MTENISWYFPFHVDGFRSAEPVLSNPPNVIFAAGLPVAGAPVAGAPVAGAPVAGAPVAGPPSLGPHRPSITLSTVLFINATPQSCHCN